MIVDFDLTKSEPSSPFHILKVVTLMDGDPPEDADVEGHILTRDQLLSLKKTVDEYVEKITREETGTCGAKHPHIPNTVCERRPGHATGSHIGKQYGQYDKAAW